MIDLKELKKLLDNGLNCSTDVNVWYKDENCNAREQLRDKLYLYARELLRMAEIGKRTEELMADKKDHDDYMSGVTAFFNKSGARL